jgi:hypothetical protein
VKKYKNNLKAFWGTKINFQKVSKFMDKIKKTLIVIPKNNKNNKNTLINIKSNRMYLRKCWIRAKTTP